MKTPMQEFWNKIALKLSIEQVNEFLPEFDIALEKEKEQIIEAYDKGVDIGLEAMELTTDYLEAEEYYNQTYNQNKL